MRLLPEWRPRMEWAVKEFCQGSEVGGGEVSYSPRMISD